MPFSPTPASHDTLLDSERRLSRQNSALQRLTRANLDYAGDFTAFVRGLTEIAATTLSVERVGVWLFDAEHGAIHCIDLFERSRKRHSSGVTLEACDYPAYFRALEEERIIAAHDAHRDRRTREFSEGYLTPLGIHAMLDAPILVRGALQGVICHEHVGSPRQWFADEQHFAGALGDLIGTVLLTQERNEVEKDLKEREQRLRGIMDNVADGIITIHEDGRIESINAAAERLFGYSASEVLGKNVKVLMPEPFRQDHDMHLQRHLRTGDRKCLGKGFRELRGLHKDGHDFPIDLSISEMTLDGDRLYIGIVRDVTERKSAEQKLVELSGALEQTADSIIITDREGVIEYVNAGFEQTTGYRRDEVLGKKPNVIKSGLQDEQFYKRLWGTILAGKVFREVLINRKKDGGLYYEEKTITPLRGPDGGITRFISSGKDITERMQTEERLRHLAYHDPLTGLPNRTLFMDRLNHAVTRGNRSHNRLALLFLDLDNFKTINDTLGHEIGDRLLQKLPQRFANCLRQGDTLARFGGDEFVILVEEVGSLDGVSHIADKIINILAQPFRVDGHELFVTGSIGITLWPDDGRDAPTLLRHADVAMYRAKDLGRNTYQFYAKDMSSRAFERLTLETNLRRALERDEYRLHYQPQIDLATGRVIGVEALIRWQHPEFGLVSPLKFIPLLEETGLILPVSEWVLRTACSQARAWQSQHTPELRIAVNLSGRQFSDATLINTLEAVLDETGLSAPLLDLEITESVLMQNDELTRKNLRKLQQLGVRISIDDFGTGYSSLSYLKRFPVHSIKIDRSFVRDITTDPEDAAIVSAIIAMADNLKLEVVAEGVETPEQRDFLKRNACDLAQGFLFGKPLPAEDMTRLLEKAAGR